MHSYCFDCCSIIRLRLFIHATVSSGHVELCGTRAAFLNAQRLCIFSGSPSNKKYYPYFTDLDQTGVGHHLFGVHYVHQRFLHGHVTDAGHVEPVHVLPPWWTDKSRFYTAYWKLRNMKAIFFVTKFLFSFWKERDNWHSMNSKYIQNISKQLLASG